MGNMTRLAAWPRNTRLRWLLTASIALLALAIGGTDAYLLAWAGRADEVALADVVSEFRGVVGGSESASADSSTDVATDPTASPSPTVGPTGPFATSADSPGTTPSPAPDPTPSPLPSGPTPLGRPEPGVYVYATDGGESISLPGGAREYPSETFGIVRHGDGCGWTMERKILEQHEELSTYCSSGAHLLQSSFETTIEFLGARETERLVCDPPVIHADRDADPGSTRFGTCEGDTVTSQGVTTYLGLTTITIGGIDVTAMHARVEGTSSGEATGTSRMEMWAHAETGLPLKLIRWSESKTNRFAAGVTYTESVTFTLMSLSPQQ